MQHDFSADHANTTTSSRAVRAQISHIRIDQLFGTHTYDFDVDKGDLDQKVKILYGENGLGKTNILSILFHLLSPHERRSHRTFLGRIPFQSVRIELSNNIAVTALRPRGKLEGAYRCEVWRLAGDRMVLLGAWDWSPTEESNKDTILQRVLVEAPQSVRKVLEESTRSTKSKRNLSATRQESLAQQLALNDIFIRYIQKERSTLEGETAFLKALRENVPPIYFLSADRIFHSDSLDRDEGGLDADFRSGRASTEMLLTKGRERALSRAVEAASRALSIRAFSAATGGSSSMHTIYAGLIERLSNRQQTGSSSISEILQKLENLGVEYEQYAQYALAPDLAVDQLISNLKHLQAEKLPIAVDILQPYVESLNEQSKGLRAAYIPINRLVVTINEFLFNKHAGFTLGKGLFVKDLQKNVLQPKDLSSGEQQLLLLFCHIALAEDRGGIFIVDEPELSLNIKWQRRLVRSLLELDQKKSLQFILASHSMEVITAFSDEVVVLEDHRHG